MAHEITDTDSLFSVREATWHGLGHVLEEYPTRAAAQAIAHPWEPVPEPIYRKVPFVSADGELGERYEEIANYQANVRDDNGFTLGVTSATYEPVLNNTLWDIAEALEDGAGGEALYETGGSLAGGKVVWLLMKLREPLVIKGDPRGAVIPYYNLRNNHDAFGSFKGQGTTMRVVCANTLRAADMDAKARGTEFTFRHTKNVGDRIEEARKALAGWRASVEDFRLLSEHLITLNVSDEGVKQFTERFIPEPPPAMASERVMHNVEQARADWFGVLNSITCEGIDRTAYGLVQASAEYTEHIRAARSQESRFRRAWMEPNRILGDARKLAEEAALV